MPGEGKIERVAPLTATEVKRLARRHGVACGDDGGMGAGHAVFFGEVVGGFAVKFELHLCVVIEQLHAVPLLRVNRPHIAFRGEDVCGDGRAVFRQFVEFEATGEHAQFAPGTGLGVVLVGDGGRDGVFRPHGHGFVAEELAHGGFRLGDEWGCEKPPGCGGFCGSGRYSVAMSMTKRYLTSLFSIRS